MGCVVDYGTGVVELIVHFWGGCVQELIDRIRAFNLERQWGQYHSPKNLVMALAGEVGELIEHFQGLCGVASSIYKLWVSGRFAAGMHKLSDLLRPAFPAYFVAPLTI